jgi:hypothetical protein
MQHKEIHLDNDAKKLYQQLEGLEDRQVKGFSSLEADRLSQSLKEEERHFDALRLLLANLVYHLSVCLYGESLKNNKPEELAFHQLEKIFGKFCKNPGIGNATLIRHRGAFRGDNLSEKIDYEILFGDIVLDSNVALYMLQRQGTQQSHLPDQLTKAFETFWQRGINNFFLRLPKKIADLKRLWITLQIIARYYMALETDSPLVIKMSGKKMSLPPVYNEQNIPDLNLTLLALLNGLRTTTMQNLVQKVDVWMQHSESTKSGYQYISIYDAILGSKGFGKKLKPPPIEVNNIKWFMLENDEKTTSKKMAHVARLVMDSSGGSTIKTASVLRSVYGEDYKRIDSQKVVERLQATSGLLDTIEEKSAGKEIEGEVLDNVEKRLDQVSDEVYDNLFVEGNKVEASSADKETFIGKVHTKLVNFVSFYKKRSATKKKMKDMVHHVIDFDDQDYETLAKDFKVTVNESEKLIRMLKSCFDSQGNFRKGIFSNIIPDLVRYERRIFDFLWHHLKESLHQKDRAAFLDSLQLLVDRLKQPKKSIAVLLEDLIHNPSIVRFADRKAFMLGSRLVRKYSQELVSYQITPEDVLLVDEGLDKNVANYTAWKIDKEQERFFEKIKTVHMRVAEALDSDDDDAQLMSSQDLLALEREAYLFLSLVGGNTARSVILSALKEYGYPESEIYQLKKSPSLMSDLLQLLKVAIRGWGRLGKSNESSSLDDIKGRLEVFVELTNSMHQEDLINQIREWIDASKDKIAQKA